MWLMGSLGVFFTERDYLIIEANVFRWYLDDQDIVYLSSICLSQGTRGSSKLRASNDGFDFPDGSKPAIFGLFLWPWSLLWTSVCWMTNIFLQLTLSNKRLHLLFSCHAVFCKMVVVLVEPAV